MVLGVKNSPASAGDVKDTGSIPGLGRSFKKEMSIHFSIFAWKILWTADPGGLYSPWGRKESDTAEQLSMSLNMPFEEALQKTLAVAREAMNKNDSTETDMP